LGGRRVIQVSFFFILCLLLRFSPLYAATLSASGCSVSTIGYLADLSKEYEKRTGMRILLRSGGSIQGIEDLRSGKVDFAACCRGKLSTDPEGLNFIQVAWDALVFIVHPSTPLNSVTVKDIRAIYFGGVTDWKQLGGNDRPIKLLISKPQKGLSGVEASLRGLVLEGREPVQTPNTLALVSTGIVEQIVEKTPDSFAAAGYASARKRNVKMLKVNGISPSKQAIATGRYPFRRPLFLVVPKTPGAETKKFIDFTLSREGQQFISTLGIVPLREAK
jgi:phosphate transport system substrate-binding protein